MATRYSDVDLLILKRWDDVSALVEAYFETLGTMAHVVGDVIERVSRVLTERELESEFNAKSFELYFWKPEWANRKREAGIYYAIIDFVPEACGKNIAEHSSILVKTEDFSTLRMQESCEQFGRAVRAALPQELREKWTHESMDIGRAPLGKDQKEVSDKDRVALVSEQEALFRFIMERVEDCMEVVPAIEATLMSMTRK